MYEVEWGGEGEDLFVLLVDLKPSDAWINSGTSCRSEASRTWNPRTVDPSKSTLSVAVKHQCMAMHLTLSPARYIAINASLKLITLYTTKNVLVDLINQKLLKISY